MTPSAHVNSLVVPRLLQLLCLQSVQVDEIVWPSRAPLEVLFLQNVYFRSAPQMQAKNLYLTHMPKDGFYELIRQKPTMMRSVRRLALERYGIQSMPRPCDISYLMDVLNMVRDQLGFFGTDYKLARPLGRLPRLKSLGVEYFADVVLALQAMPAGHKLDQLTIMDQYCIQTAEPYISEHCKQLRVGEKTVPGRWANARLSSAARTWRSCFSNRPGMSQRPSRCTFPRGSSLTWLEIGFSSTREASLQL